MPLTTEGAAYILGAICDGATIAANDLVLGLATSAPTAASTMADVASFEHPNSGSYARQSLTSANLAVSGNNVNAATPVRFGTGMVITNATHWFVACNGASTTARNTGGKLLAWGALGATRTLATADYLDVDFDWTLATT